MLNVKPLARRQADCFRLFRRRRCRARRVLPTDRRFPSPARLEADAGDGGRVGVLGHRSSRRSSSSSGGGGARYIRSLTTSTRRTPPFLRFAYTNYTYVPLRTTGFLNTACGALSCGAAKHICAIAQCTASGVNVPRDKLTVRWQRLAPPLAGASPPQSPHVHPTLLDLATPLATGGRRSAHCFNLSLCAFGTQ